MPTKLKFKENVRDDINKGISIVAAAVSTTMGPKGRNAIIADLVSDPYITKDGVTVAKSIKLEDRFENLGAKLIVRAAMKTAEEAGDGTTTCTVLTNEIYKQGLKYLSAGVNPIQLKKGMDLAVQDVINELKELSLEVKTSDQIKQVATISANNDDDIGELISQAFDAVGHDGVISIDESKTFEDMIEVVNGMQYKRGFMSPHFATDDAKTKADLAKPIIILYNGKIMSVKELLPLLEQLVKTDPQRNILIIADEIEGEALSTLVVNKLRGILNVCAIRTPGFGESKKAILEDIAIVTGGKVIDPELGETLINAQLSDLGSAEKITVTKGSTTIINGGGDPELVKARIKQLYAELDSAPSAYAAENILKRLARLKGGVAIIKLGAVSEVELNEKKDRVDDALSATRAAIDEGIVPGAGTAFLKIMKKLSSKDLSNLSDDQKLGYNLILQSLEKPAAQILENAGLKVDAIIEKILENKIEGFNVLTEEACNLIENGIIDPSKVERVALQNAESIASMLLTADVSIVEFPEESKIAPQDAMNQLQMM